MLNHKIARTAFLAFMAFSLTSLSLIEEPRSRTVACLPEGAGGISGGPIGLGQDLIGQVKDEALRQSARDWYYYLSEVELTYLSNRQAVRSNYGLKGNLFASAPDYTLSLAPFQLGSAYGPTGLGFASFSGFRGFTSVAPTLPAVGLTPSMSFNAPSARIASGGSAIFSPL